VIDGRVDAALEGTPAAGLGVQDGHELLAATLSRLGPDGLDHLAADFALARVDRRRRTMLLARDAFGMRPLFWARRGTSVGFATDPDVLRTLGLVTGELDRERVAAYLAQLDREDEGTGFAGVQRVPGGDWIEVDLSGRVRQAHWFRPEAVTRRDWSFDEAVHAVNAAVVDAVADRVRGRRAVLLLSGGRDSGSVAVAAARAGASPLCLTKTYDPDLPCDEAAEARHLADRLGLAVEDMFVPTVPTAHHLEQLPSLSGTPLGYAISTEAVAIRDGVADATPDVVLDGDGGDDLFASGPVAALDLLRSGQLLQAAAAARSFPVTGRYDWWVVLKTLGRAVTPSAALRARERARPWPSWVLGSPPALAPDGPVRSDRQLLLDHLRGRALHPLGELPDRIVRSTGARMASPLLDQRVIRLVLSLPVAHRVPRPGPKPLLAGAFLGDLDHTRRKTSFLPHYRAVARASQQAFAHWLGRDSLVVRHGFVRDEPPREDASPAEALGVLRRLTVEAWLRSQ
jgi:asparagine synthase (glutamine-hydrolysing)